MMAPVESVMKTYYELRSGQSKRSELDMNATVDVESQLSMEKCNSVDSKSNEHQVQVILGKSLGCILKRTSPKKPSQTQPRIETRYTSCQNQEIIS